MTRLFLWYFTSFILSYFLLTGMFSCAGLTVDESQKDLIEVDGKHRGAHIFGHIDSTNLKPFIQNNFDWVTLVAWGHQEEFDSPEVNYHRGDSLRMLRRDSAWIKQIEIAHAAGLKVFVKPHIWIFAPSTGKWRSDIFPIDEESWELWKTSYRKFIFHYARIAERANAEMFCIGTEFTRLTIEKPLFWKKLIKDVRKIYSGKITYAANWYKEYEAITFWDDLDYIGIQAYFPLVKNEHPSAEQIAKGWNKHLRAIESVQKQYNRKVLFTEMGYKSTSDNGIRPWEWLDYSSTGLHTLSYETQANCYKAFFDSVWGKEWFAGVHIWQLRSDFEKNDGYSNLDFTPQGKLAEEVIRVGFILRKIE